MWRGSVRAGRFRHAGVVLTRAVESALMTLHLKRNLCPLSCRIPPGGLCVCTDDTERAGGEKIGESETEKPEHLARARGERTVQKFRTVT